MPYHSTGNTRSDHMKLTCVFFKEDLGLYSYLTYKKNPYVFMSLIFTQLSDISDDVIDIFSLRGLWQRA